MYSLALIIFVVSEKKAFEHFPMDPMLIYVLRWRPSWISDRHKEHKLRVHWMVLYKIYVFCSGMKFKMAATAGFSLTLDPMGKMFQNASSLKPLGHEHSCTVWL
jgi:hypothetical protein